MKALPFALALIAGFLCAACSSAFNGQGTVAPLAPSAKKTTQNLVNWPVWGFDPARSGFNSAEQTLTTANVGQLRMQWQAKVNVTGQPAASAPILVVGAGPSSQTMLYETTKQGETIGVDASSGNVVWRFDTKHGNATQSAPAADPSGKFVYAPGLDGKVHKLDAATGSEVQDATFPVLISLEQFTERDESPLNVANGYVYAVLGGAGSDQPPYNGHIVGVNLSNGQVSIFNSLCSDLHVLLSPSSCAQQQSGIWARGGAVADPDPAMNGRIYVATGNGHFDADSGGNDYGSSVISVTSDLSTILGSYTPPNYQQLNKRNKDLGSTAPALLPEQPASQTPWMLVQGGKDRVLRLLNRATLPGVGGELQKLTLPRSLFSAPAIWTDPSNNVWVFIGLQMEVRAYRLSTDASGVSQLQEVWSASPGTTKRGTSPVVANGILFVAFDGALIAYDASSGAKLWSSTNPSAGGTIGVVHFQSPIVVNGWVYCDDQNGRITAYALPESPKHRRSAPK
jgi:outer membrane protein assembly factor BamB